MKPSLLLDPPPRLLALRERSLGASLVVLRAPAGYGKTALVRSWLEGRGTEHSWIELGRDQLPPPGPTRGIHVLDRVELADSEQGARLPAMAAQARPGSPLILIGRSAPPLPLGRHRLEGTVVELGVAELGRSEEEARQALAAAGLPAPEFLLRLAAGWPAALALGATVIARSTDGTDFETLGERQELYEYLAEEVLPPRESHQERLLLETLELDAIAASPPLTELARDCPLIIPMDDRGLQYRLHPLLKQALRRRRRERSGATPALEVPEAQVLAGAMRPPLLDYGDRARPQDPRPAGSTDGLLSPREIELLGVLSRGHSPDEAAELLFISPHTVRTHIRNIYGKLGTRRLVETLNRAAELGVLAPADPVRSYHGPAVGRGDEGGPRDRLPIPR